MSANAYFCPAHQANATEFCLCGKVPVYLCTTCLPKHKKKSSHDVFPMANLGLYRALGNNKAELVRRIETVKYCSDFLNNASAREAAVLTEANNLITDLVQCYQGWLDMNHRCFTNLVESLREEVASLMTTPKMTLSPLSQIMVERSHALSSKEENLFCAIPEEKSLKKIMEHCNQALMKTRRVQQQDYENEIQQAFMKLSQGVQQVPAEEIKVQAQRVQAPVQIVQKVPAEEVKVQAQRVQAPAQGLQEIPAQGDVQKLIAVLAGEVKLFNVATSQWQQLCALRGKINVDCGTSSTFIAPTIIFVCGGGKEPCTCHVDNRAYVLKADNGSVQELPHMSQGRQWPGVAWDSSRKALYVFGGYDRGTCYTGLLRTSEMFLFNQWSPLADMHQGRDAFNPCWHSCLVYLCGGYTNSVETYDPRSNTFALQDFTLPESDSGTTAVVQCGVVTVISKNYISKLQQGRLTSQKHEEYYPWSNYTPVVSGGAVYIIDLDPGKCCRCIDLTTGAVRKSVRLS